ncbi:MAG: O-antigen ligase family protein [Sulfuritalea sp.]|nr:O-antigen ligase family protein [Sulfuritalea sp.]
MFHSIPGTGAVRSLFLLLMIGGVACHSWRARAALKWPPFDLVGKALLLLTAWLAFQSVFLAVDGPGTLKTFAVEWPKNLLLAAIGIWIARAAMFARKGKWVFIAVFCGFFAHVLGTLGYQAWGLITKGQLDLAMSLLGNYGYVSPFLDGAFAIAFADAASRLCLNRRLLPVSTGQLAAIFFLSTLALFALKSKASLLTALLMLGLFAVIVATQVSRYRKQILASALIAALGLIAMGILVQGRWSSSLESIRYGVAIDKHKNWMQTENGISDESFNLPGHIDHSFYARAAWATVGFQGLAEYPLGRGYGSNAFGRYLTEKYGILGAISSHSGWLDFAMANGIPGLVLLLAASAALYVRGWKSFVNNTGVGGLALAFLTTSYISRCMFDGLMSTSKLMAFFLVSGVLWGLSRDADPPRESCSA